MIMMIFYWMAERIFFLIFYFAYFCKSPNGEIFRGQRSLWPLICKYKSMFIWGGKKPYRNKYSSLISALNIDKNMKNRRWKRVWNAIRTELPNMGNNILKLGENWWVWNYILRKYIVKNWNFIWDGGPNWPQNSRT